jgi:hypothetical protein
MDRETRNWVVGMATVLGTLALCCLYNAAHASAVFRFERVARTHHSIRPDPSDEDTFFRWSASRLLQAVAGHSFAPHIVWQFEGYGQAACGAWVDTIGDENATENRFIVVGDQVIWWPVDVTTEWLPNCGNYYGAQE